jgi:hypothetical protein
MYVHDCMYHLIVKSSVNFCAIYSQGIDLIELEFYFELKKNNFNISFLSLTSPLRIIESFRVEKSVPISDPKCALSNLVYYIYYTDVCSYCGAMVHDSERMVRFFTFLELRRDYPYLVFLRPHQ